MSELEKRIEELSQSFQDSYDADIDLLTRHDKAYVNRIAELEEELKGLYALLADRARAYTELQTDLAAKDSCIAELETEIGRLALVEMDNERLVAQLAQAQAGRWMPVEGNEYGKPSKAKGWVVCRWQEEASE